MQSLSGPPSQKVALQFKATLENVTNLRPMGEDFRWYLKVRLEGRGPGRGEGKSIQRLCRSFEVPGRGVTPERGGRQGLGPGKCSPNLISVMNRIFISSEMSV